MTKDLTVGQSMMSLEDWYREHGLRKDGKGRKPGPKPKKKKMVWQLEPGERGNGTEPAEPIDIEGSRKSLWIEKLLLLLKRNALVDPTQLASVFATQY